MKIEELDKEIRIICNDGGIIDSQTAEANILYEILQELKRIKRLLQTRSPLSVKGE